MKLPKPSQEFSWIAQARKIFGPAGAFWEKGSGDDAAVWRSRGRQSWVWSQDALVENQHFRIRDLASLRDLGFKALAVNLSDLAAMAAQPRGALVALALPKKTSFAQFRAFCQGMAQASKKYACPMVGGDLVASPQHWMVSVSILGEAPQGAVGREGAQAGEELWVSGSLGEAALGFRLMESSLKPQASWRPFQQKQFRPEPRLDFAQKLIKAWKLTSLLDLSDGLFQGLTQLAEASGVGFELDLGVLKPKKPYLKLCAQLGLDPWDLILSGGEDYELLWTLQAGQEAAFRAWVARLRLPFYPLGRSIVDKSLHIFCQGRPYLKKPKLFEHF